jgi:WD40 repeat protein
MPRVRTFAAPLFDLTTGKELRRFKGHDGFAYPAAFSPDGRRALSGGQDKTMRLWDLETGKELRRFEGHTAFVMRVAFMPDGRCAVSAGTDKTVRVWALPR